MNKSRVLPIIGVLAIVGAASWFLAARNASAANTMWSGTVEATDADLGFAVPGRIATVLPHEGDRVKAGDTLALLDRTELAARRAQATAALAAARAGLAELQRGARPEELAQARVADSTAAARLTNAQRDLDRVTKLFDGGAVSRETLDKARLALDVAHGAKTHAEEQLRLVQAGPRTERIDAQRAVVQQAQAALNQAAASMDNGVIVAPFDGVVAVRDREPGETVSAGMPVVTLMQLSDRWVRIYVREDRIGAVKLGQRASISTDTYPDSSYPGTVSYIASQAEFTPRNVQTTEERVTLVYAVKVRITGDSGNNLKPGMPADVKLGGNGQ
ncbi:MAG TPA: HlyD family efflux transporter periplasmic adaptor subunit [Gemmatimonadaceae bacterium]|nr:HlyD family efflux transporter periplasmic adaptor subunit [Gemmatimonadaceae bacterium]